jgi:hypothetical protein
MPLRCCFVFFCHGFCNQRTLAPLPLDYGTAPLTPFPLPPSVALPAYNNIGGSLGANNVPILFDLNTAGTAPIPSTITCGTSTSPINQLYYSYVVKPEWMFKYYVYNLFDGPSGPIDDGDRLIPNQVLVDINRLYNHPNTYVGIPQGYNSSVELCKEPPALTYTNSSTVYTYTNTHQYWSAAERLNFFKEIRGSAKCFEIKGVDNVNQIPRNPLCPTKADMIAKALDVVTTHTAIVGNLALEVKSSLIAELTSSCYTRSPLKGTNG